MTEGREAEKKAIETAAEMLCLAIRTAPKARGQDTLKTAVILPEDKEMSLLITEMERLSSEKALPSFSRDAANIRQSGAVVLAGTSIKTVGLKYCGLCGFGNCEGKEKHPDAPCVFNSHDLGLAVGSAVSKAADLRADNRIMYSAGMAARNLSLLGDGIKIIMAIPLYTGGKNIFFDRRQ